MIDLRRVVLNKENTEFEEAKKDEQEGAPSEEYKEEPDSTTSENSEEKSTEEKLKECEDRYLRVHADFENVKKRLEKEKYQLLDYAYEKFAKDLLPVADSLEMALQSLNNESCDNAELLDKLKEGVELTLENLNKTFNKHGIEHIKTDDGFDPHLHDAVMKVESEEHDEGDIVQHLQKGYKYKQRVLRPSMVSICKK